MRTNTFFIFFLLLSILSCNDLYDENDVAIIGTGKIYYYSDDRKQYDGNIYTITKYNHDKLPIVEIEISPTDNKIVETTLCYYDSSKNLIRKESFNGKNVENRFIYFYNNNGDCYKAIFPEDEREISRTYISEYKYDSCGMIIYSVTSIFAQYKDEEPYLEKEPSIMNVKYSNNYLKNWISFSDSNRYSYSENKLFDEKKNLIQKDRIADNNYRHFWTYKYDENNHKIYEGRKVDKVKKFNTNIFDNEFFYSYNDSGQISTYKLYTHGIPQYEIKYEYKYIKK